MSKLFQKATTLLTGPDTTGFLRIPKGRPFKKLTERELIQLESEIGKQLFGPIPKNHRREFFNLDKNTWIWYEEYLDESGAKKSSTTRYEVQEKGVLKAQDGARYSYIEGVELQNLVVAVQMYYEQVTRELYKRDPETGRKLQ